MWLDLTTTHQQTWLFSSTSTYHSTDLLAARGVAHLVVLGTSGSTSYETIPPVRLETCCRPWTWWCNDATALAGYATMMMMWLLSAGVFGGDGWSNPDHLLCSGGLVVWWLGCWLATEKVADLTPGRSAFR